LNVWIWRAQKPLQNLSSLLWSWEKKKHFTVFANILIPRSQCRNKKWNSSDTETPVYCFNPIITWCLLLTFFMHKFLDQGDHEVPDTVRGVRRTRGHRRSCRIFVVEKSKVHFRNYPQCERSFVQLKWSEYLCRHIWINLPPSEPIFMQNLVEMFCSNTFLYFISIFLFYFFLKFLFFLRFEC